MFRDPHPRSTDPLYLWPDLVIQFDRSGDPILPTALRCGTVSGVFCVGDQWDDEMAEPSVRWPDGIR